jgi:hypothetical protein
MLGHVLAFGHRNSSPLGLIVKDNLGLIVKDNLGLIVKDNLG